MVKQLPVKQYTFNIIGDHTISWTINHQPLASIMQMGDDNW